MQADAVIAGASVGALVFLMGILLQLGFIVQQLHEIRKKLK